MATQDEYIKTALRLPRHLHADISVSAENAGRSMNAEIIERLSKSSDMSHLHRVIEQLTQTMAAERQGLRIQLGWALMLYEQTIRALDEAVLLAEQNNAPPEEIRRLQGEIEHAQKYVKTMEPAADRFLR
ncbi:Arc-like DNA binding dprotein [Paraburkholderia sp. BL18I3N2]|uniref:Arc family DNA-binding protein n=1 Tax=Paraburkholderia sp. BL18I3N2 TaxID=1938799 RepID=UPI000D07B038|nr:Arc family DNA-binding protein [Paraburkholderia sp. BL18I3N2]PRX32234.1 Arc-like DNA binding dprotein [Paraburkholderia sp. BL18I3N2]